MQLCDPTMNFSLWTHKGVLVISSDKSGPFFFVFRLDYVVGALMIFVPRVALNRSLRGRGAPRCKSAPDALAKKVPTADWLFMLLIIK